MKEKRTEMTQETFYDGLWSEVLSVLRRLPKSEVRLPLTGVNFSTWEEAEEFCRLATPDLEATIDRASQPPAIVVQLRDDRV